MSASIQMLLASFLEWLQSKAAEEELFSWLTFVVIIGGCYASFAFIIRITWKFCLSRYKAIKYYGGATGKFYLYHPPLVGGISDFPRVTYFCISKGLFSPVRVSQKNIKPLQTVYDGTVISTITSYFMYMVSPHFSLEGCPKAIVMWHFQRVPEKDFRFSVGVMCCVTNELNPYKVPILVSEIPLCTSTVEKILQYLSVPIITGQARRYVLDIIKNSDDISENDMFEQFHGPPISIIKENRSWIIKVIERL